MAINLSTLSNVANKVNTASGLILVIPDVINSLKARPGYQPQVGPELDNSISELTAANPFVFQSVGDEMISLESEVSDHWIQNNTSVQDQVALKPLEFSVTGYIGELNDVVPDLLRPVRAAADRLQLLVAYTPELSLAATQAYNQAKFFYDTAKNAVSAATTVLQTLTGGTVQNKQQQAFNQFYNFWQKRTLFTIQTPWNQFNNMIIKSLRANQSEETRMITSFEITFKKMQFISVTTNTLLSNGRLIQQRASVTENGIKTPGPVQSFLSRVATDFGVG